MGAFLPRYDEVEITGGRSVCTIHQLTVRAVYKEVRIYFDYDHG